MNTTQPTVHPLSLGLLMMVMGIMSPAHANNYTLEQTLANPTPENSDYFGSSVAVGGTTAVVGAGGDGSSSGSAYVFDTTTGNLIATLANPTPGYSDNFGNSVSVSGQTVLVGARYDDPNGITNAGSAYVFQNAQSVPEPGSLALLCIGLLFLLWQNKTGLKLTLASKFSKINDVNREDIGPEFPLRIQCLNYIFIKEWFGKILV